jgi:hypothetical protein
MIMRWTWSVLHLPGGTEENLLLGLQRVGGAENCTQLGTVKKAVVTELNSTPGSVVNVGKVYSLGYTDIPKVFFTPPMLSGSLVTMAWRVLRLRMEEKASRCGG